MERQFRPDQQRTSAAADADVQAGEKSAFLPMALPYRQEMEASFGESFGDVQASTGLREPGVQASAQGNQVAFASTEPSKFLVAHELTHIVQQRRGGGVERANYETGGTR